MLNCKEDIFFYRNVELSKSIEAAAREIQVPKDENERLQATITKSDAIENSKCNANMDMKVA